MYGMKCVYRWQLSEEFLAGVHEIQTRMSWIHRQTNLCALLAPYVWICECRKLQISHTTLSLTCMSLHWRRKVKCCFEILHNFRRTSPEFRGKHHTWCECGERQPISMLREDECWLPYRCTIHLTVPWLRNFLHFRYEYVGEAMPTRRVASHRGDNTLNHS